MAPVANMVKYVGSTRMNDIIGMSNAQIEMKKKWNENIIYVRCATCIYIFVQIVYQYSN